MREVGEGRGCGTSKVAVAAGQVPGLRAIGQRSISSMFSNARCPPQRSGDRSSPMPWLEFLSRNQEKRYSQNQICQVTGGLTPEVKKRLETACCDSIHPRTTKPLVNTRSPDSQRSMASTSDSFRPLKRTTQQLRTEDAMGSRLDCPLNMDLSRSGSKDAIGEKSLKRKQDPESRQYARAGTKLEISNDLLRSQKMEREMPAKLETPIFQASFRIPVNRRQMNEGDEHVGCNYRDFIDLTVDEDRGIRRMEDEHGDAFLDEGRNDKQRKRRLLLSEEDCQPMESCPVCNDMFPVHMLQAHVEEELGALEIVERNAVSEEPSMPSRESESEDCGCDYAWQDQGPTFQTKISGGSVHIRQPARRRMLVLGDEPKSRRRANPWLGKKKPAAIFNHYADGGGWWDEGGVGVDAEAVGSTSVWEGLGSLSFGSML